MIAATNRDLEKDVAEGRFRLDLYQRLKVQTIQVPPLRERREDIPILAKKFLAQIKARWRLKELPSLDRQSLEALADREWPGNVRELRNYLERALIDPEIRPGTLCAVFEERRESQASVQEESAKTDENDETWVWTTEFPQDRSYEDIVADLKRSLIEEALRRTKGKVIPAARMLRTTRDVLNKQFKTLKIDHRQWTHEKKL